MEALKEILEDAIAKERFSMRKLFQEVVLAINHTPTLRSFIRVTKVLGQKTSLYIFESLLRAAFLIELVKTPKIETTKMEVRWTARLNSDDSRYADFEDCYQIFQDGMVAVEDAVNDAEKREIFVILSRKRLVAYEIPLDYKHREISSHIHRSDNMVWLWDDEKVKQAIRLRMFLTDRANNSHITAFVKAYKDKIQVKTYLTDRVLTGEYKTNREKRWEVHPASVHFAFRRNCMEIEYELVNQLCQFEGFPLDLKRLLENAELIVSTETSYRCPITLDPLHFDKFVDAVSHPTHGKSLFQVGHMNPLKAINDDLYSGHTSANIGWISSDGNRIQGSLTLDQTRKLMGRIVANYEQLGVPLSPGAEEETIMDIEDESIPEDVKNDTEVEL